MAADNPINILVYVALWKRPEITRLCFEGLRILAAYNPAKYAISVLAVISEDESRELCEEYGIDFIYHPNEPLGLKMNEGLAECMERPFDYLLQINSDDIISGQLLDLYLNDMREGTHFFGINEICFVDSQTARAKFYQYPHDYMAFGCARMFSRFSLLTIKNRELVRMNTSLSGPKGQVFKGQVYAFPLSKSQAYEDRGIAERIGAAPFKLWTDDKNRFLDTDSNKTMNESGFFIKQIPLNGKPLAVDVKSPLNMWNYDQYDGVEFPLDDLKRYFHPSLIDYIKTLQPCEKEAIK